MTYGNSDRLVEIDCWCDHLEIMAHGNSDRIVYMEAGKLIPNIETDH